MPRQSDAVREASAARVRRLVAGVQSALPHASRATASVVAGTLVGTLQLARALGANADGRAMLAAARKALIHQYDTPARRPAESHSLQILAPPWLALKYDDRHILLSARSQETVHEDRQRRRLRHRRQPARRRADPAGRDEAREVAAAAARTRDVTLVINNAGIGQLGGFLASDSEESARRHLETNFFGMLRMSQAFAPVLAANGGGALVNVLSIVTWINGRRLAAYAASKSAAWSLTNALRHELAAQRTHEQNQMLGRSFMVRIRKSVVAIALVSISVTPAAFGQAIGAATDNAPSPSAANRLPRTLFISAPRGGTVQLIYVPDDGWSFADGAIGSKAAMAALTRRKSHWRCSSMVRPDSRTSGLAKRVGSSSAASLTRGVERWRARSESRRLILCLHCANDGHIMNAQILKKVFRTLPQAPMASV
jgi:NAD(P)-dependent dehydrogenase (short-subunit alcohol dehydrogenase family)